MIPTLHLAVVLTTAVAALAAGLRNDPGIADGYLSLRRNNSHIVINTRRIDQVVAVGPVALGPLVREMKRPDVTVDTFARCYSACDQILRNAGLKSRVRWHGGLIQTDKKTGRVAGISRINGFSAAFRQAQIEEIVRRAKEVRIALADGQ